MISCSSDPEKGSTSHSIQLERDPVQNALLFTLARPAVAVSSVGATSSAFVNGLRVGDEFSILNDVDVHNLDRDALIQAIAAAAFEHPAVAILARARNQPATGYTPNTSAHVDLFDMI